MSGREIFIVTQGDYSDYHIVAVFDDQAIAEQWVELRNSTKPSDSFVIETYSVNTAWAVQETERGLIWECSERLPNYSLRCRQPYVDAEGISAYPPRFNDIRMGGNHWQVAVHARDEQEAIKIAAEKIAQAKAEQQGIA
jgi:hypothetical protein